MEGEIRFDGGGFGNLMEEATAQYTRLLDELCALEELGNSAFDWEGIAKDNWQQSFNKEIDRLRIILFRIQNLISCTNIMARRLMEVKATVSGILL